MNKRRVGLALGLLLALGLVWNVSQEARWEYFYRTQVEGYFTLPSELQVVHWEERHTFPIGNELEVRFRLPGTGPPEQWVSQIAKQSAMGDFRQGPYLYRGGDRRLEYDPLSGRYMASSSFQVK